MVDFNDALEGASAAGLIEWNVWDERGGERDPDVVEEAYDAEDAAESWGVSALLLKREEETVACVSRVGSDVVERFVVELEVECRARLADEDD